MIKLLTTTLLLALFLAFNVSAANIVSSVDRNPVNLDESFQLILEADGPVDDDPDFSVLENNFDILSNSQSTNMSFVNGMMSQKRVWTLVLMARQPGNFSIPSIEFGKDKSPSLRLTVTDNPANTNTGPNTGNDTVYLEVEVDQNRVWVQSQIVYTLRVFHRVSVNNPSLSQLQTSDKDAIVERLGNAKNYEAFRNGVRYNVSELNFAVYPQHSGNLIFKPLTFEGSISTSRSQSLFDQFMGGGKIVRVRSQSLSVNVEPRPDTIQLKNWLPAEKVTLEEKWSADIKQLKTGEPVTRTITMTAKGQMSNYLPDLNLPEIDGFKQYPDKPAQDDKPSSKGMTGSRQIKIAMIPTRAGSFTVPAVTIPWWNTATETEEVVRLPATTLQVQGIPGTQPTNQPMPGQPGTSSPEQNMTTHKESLANVDSDPGFWPWLSLALATGWLVTLFAYMRKPGNVARADKTAKKPVTAPVKPLEQKVLKYAKDHRPGETKDALLAWAKIKWPGETLTSLVDIAAHSSPGLGKAIMSLNSALYSPGEARWTGDELGRAFKSFIRQAPASRESKKSGLEPLYKT